MLHTQKKELSQPCHSNVIRHLSWTKNDENVMPGYTSSFLVSLLSRSPPSPPKCCSCISEVRGGDLDLAKGATVQLIHFDEI